MPSLENDTIAALATPSGESAIAVVRVTGGQVRDLTAAIFGAVPHPRQARHGDYRDLAGKVVDDVVITFFAGPRSYTGEDTLEVSTHGNPFVSQRVLGDMLQRGCRAAEPGEFTKRAFLNGRLDLSQAEAVMDLIRARSDRALEAANRQLRGAVGKQVAAFIERLVAVVAQVEAYIDFPEEDLPVENRRSLQDDIARLQDDLGRMLATAHYGALLRDGVRTVIVGEPNVGKSSLLNRLLGWERALVSPEPGTTRDFLEERRVLGSHCIRFIDTAGLNTAPAPLEMLGMERTLERVDDADLVLLVLDASRSYPTLPQRVMRKLSVGNTILIWNKIDLAQPTVRPEALRGVRTVEVSAKTGVGIERLEVEIGALVDASRQEFDGEVVAINARHAHDLAEAQTCLAAAQAKLKASDPDELMASDLRGALDALGRIGGRVDHEQVLDVLFARFCIGK